jgi:hypothetical protein
MYVHMQDARVRPATRAGQGLLKYLPGLQGGRPLGRLPGGDVPQRPRGQVQQRVGEQRRHVQVAGTGPVHLAHGGGVSGVARFARRGVPVVVAGRRRRRVTRGHGPQQLADFAAFTASMRLGVEPAAPHATIDNRADPPATLEAQVTELARSLPGG